MALNRCHQIKETTISDTALIVYDHPLSPYGQKVKIALLEKGVPFDAPLPEGIGSGAIVDEFIRASPRGEVPALVEGDNVRVFDSTVILEYIEDRWPEPALLPTQAQDRARVRMLEDTMDTHFEAITWGLSEVRYFGRAEGDLADRIENNASNQIQGWYRWLTDQLGDRLWFNGSEFGWGDLAVVPFVNGAVGFGFGPQGRLADWLARSNQRDSVRHCREAAEAVAFDGSNTNLDDLKAAVAAGLFKREYRDHRLEWMIKSGGLSVVESGLTNDNIRFTDVFR
ncbi:MAG: glutathione S-transferase family protein [bacterium]|nr:glutathione S-transferase family protein [Gammaproteobacteria bacterium]HIL95005.1 glutathione S-transferase family protein [Pseudomonadales bacterium]